MSRIVLIRHNIEPEDDRIVTFLQNNGIEPEIVRPFLGEQLGNIDSSVRASVIYGGPYNVNEEERHNFLYSENYWIEGCLKLDIPLIGICQGAQSIAHVLGAYTGPLSSNECEFGYYQINATEAGKAYLPDNLVVAESHFHEFQLPEGGELLASSDLFGQQAMKYGNNTFAFQFHPEVTPNGFKRWQKLNYSHYSMPGAQTIKEQNVLMEKHDPIQHQWFMKFQAKFFKEAISDNSSLNC
jgi:GMP synthase (glutamine-hydrolysing)